MYQIYDDMAEAELLVCNFLKQMRVFWIYEQPVFYQMMQIDQEYLLPIFSSRIGDIYRSYGESTQTRL